MPTAIFFNDSFGIVSFMKCFNESFFFIAKTRISRTRRVVTTHMLGDLQIHFFLAGISYRLFVSL